MKTKENRGYVPVPKLSESEIQSFWESALNGEDREFWEAEFARDVPAEAKRGFGSFLTDLAAGRVAQPSILSAEEDARIMRRGAERVFLPKKMARLEAELGAIKRANKPSRKCQLWTYVREAKRRYPHKVSDHAFIARYVDALLERAGKELCHICPRSWTEVRDLPRLLRDGLQRPKLKQRIRVFISKVPVS
jgi:hypothetical protein